MQNKKLPDGRDKIEGNEISFRKVDRHHSGTYVCTANNGYGQEVREKIHLEVEFAPEVEVEEYFIHVTEENQVKSQDYPVSIVLFGGVLFWRFTQTLKLVNFFTETQLRFI